MDVYAERGRIGLVEDGNVVLNLAVPTADGLYAYRNETLITLVDVSEILAGEFAFELAGDLINPQQVPDTLRRS